MTGNTETNGNTGNTGTNGNTGNTGTNGNTDVVVIGGGYAGVMAANRLTRRDDVTVTLINPRPTFVERIRLHQLVAGSDDAVVEYRDVLAEGVALVVDTVTGIEAAERRVRLGTGGTVGYDYLVYAVGSGSADPGVPGAAEFAHPIATLEDAERLRPVLDAAPATAAVTVVGAGPTGIETAAELAEAGRAVTLVCGGVLGPYLHPRGRRSVAGRLAALGVSVLDGADAKVTAVTRDAVRLADGRELPSQVTVWTAGFGIPDLAARSGLTTDALGRLLTDETLTSVDDVRIVAAGDSAAPSGLPLRMSCQAAMPLGARAADTVLSRIEGERPDTLNQTFAGQCISLGRRAGIFQFAHRYDVAVWFHVAGRPGAKLKEFVCKGIVKHLADEAHKPGSYSLHRVSGGAKREELLRAKGGEAPAAAEAAVQVN
ncbi:NAD(P)/FAD-dependent oxidoreductase [Streptomyces adelaidensis]|uniref:NAD(P)/FAD-dependent oxidoreductase n=1 Tax=Streptomyces adelaidensis TaxID=2796465 RepID=UPI0019043D1D|nr:FAD-dependent oxidoreductase [Streptomyces adelaidensis]